MSFLWLSLASIIGILVGGCIGVGVRYVRYDGVITMEEKDDGKLIFSLVVASDPELLANQKEARFKIIPPSYENSRQ